MAAGRHTPREFPQRRRSWRESCGAIRAICLNFSFDMCAGAEASSGGRSYRPDYPRCPFRSVEEACRWVMAFVD